MPKAAELRLQATALKTAEQRAEEAKAKEAASGTNEALASNEGQTSTTPQQD
jgi:hypothetical protein